MATKKQKNVKLLPKLRFPEFKKDGEWRLSKLSLLASPVKEKAKSVKPDEVLTLSGEHGLVRQTDYFDNKIAGANLGRYLKIQENDFVYNDRTTSSNKYGSLKRLTKYPIGAVSPIYKCFRFNPSEKPIYWENYFEASAHESELSQFVNEGARAGRFNISVDMFLSISVTCPKDNEQQKIADCLGSLDKLIAAHSSKLDALQDHKKGLLQKLFPAEGKTTPELRFPEFKGKWNETRLEKTCESISSGRDHRNSDGEFDLYGSTGVIGKTTTPSYSGQRILIARVGANAGHLTKASGCYGVTDNTLVATLQPSINLDYIFYYLGNININRLIFGSGQPLITGSILKNLRVYLPSDTERQRVSGCLVSLDNLILSCREMLEALKIQKKGLMQQLFPSTEGGEV